MFTNPTTLPMRFVPTEITRSFIAIALAVLACAIIAAPAAIAGSGDWHSTKKIGSDGTPDDNGRSKIAFRGPRAEIKDKFDRGRATLRYTMLGDKTFGVSVDLDYRQINVRYRDNGPDAQVIVKMKSIDHTSGNVTTHLVFDSDDYPQQDDFQTKWLTEEGPNLFRLYGEVFYFEVTLRKNGPEGTPAVAIVRCTVREE